jgi:hypothetical protein
MIVKKHQTDAKMFLAQTLTLNPTNEVNFHQMFAKNIIV